MPQKRRASLNLVDPSSKSADFLAKRIYDWSALDLRLEDWGISLTTAQRGQIENYLGLVACHNLKSGLTSDIAPQTLLFRHAADALAATPYLRKKASEISPRLLRVADLGAGGGFIGITLKIALPEIDMTLIEPLKRRFDFLNLALIALGLKGIHLTRKSAGNSPDSDSFDVVIERALAPFPKAATLALTRLKPQGLFIAYQSQVSDHFSKSLSLKERIPYRLPKEEKERYLIVSIKGNQTTPEKED